ncbi:MAG: MBL fold metallo-hydrolase [Halothermotrichaceae bacterium]
MNNSVIIQALGTAQDGGYPQPCCSCPHCREAVQNPDLNRLQSSVGLLDREEKKTFILDITPAFPGQIKILNKLAANEGLSDDHFSGVMLTHAHMGHYTGLMYLGKEVLNTVNLPVYLSKAMLNFLENNAPWSDLIENRNIKAIILNENKKVQVSKNISIRGITVPHRNEHADTLAFMVEAGKRSFLYLPDFDHWGGFIDDFKKILKEVDFALIDGTFYDRTELQQFRGRDLKQVPHPPIMETMELLSDLSIEEKQKIIFTHFNHTNRILERDGAAKKNVEERGYRLLKEEEIL